MRRKLKNVRPIRIGLRLQISLIMIFSIALISFILSVAIFKKSEQTVIKEITHFSGAILKGIKRETKLYLYYDREVRNFKKSGESRLYLNDCKTNRDEAIQKVMQFFPDIISRDTMLDVAFLINIIETDNTSESKRNRFLYFDRNHARVDDAKNSYDEELIQLLDFFLETIETGVNFKQITTRNRKIDQDDSVVVGLPVFSGDFTEELYNKYKDFYKSLTQSLPANPETSSLQEQHSYFEQEFIKRLVYNYTDFDYKINAASDKDYNRLFVYFSAVRYTGRLTHNQREIAQKEFTEQLKSLKSDLSFQTYSETCDQFRKKYNLRLKPNIHNWTGLYRFLERNSISVSSPVPIQELALQAYKSDLNGIIGIRLLSKEFFVNLNRNRNEVTNLALAIFLRFIIIALLFPGFIIRKINKLADGAYEIGRGNFDYKFNMRGSDEVGRLSDIFNIMGKNLKKAREEMIEKNRMSTELKTAHEIQSVLLPSVLPDINKLQFSSYYASQSEAGGDYYDVIPLAPDKLALVIADVSGHGVGSGLVMTITRTLIHSFSSETVKPSALLEKLNEHLYLNTASNFFVSMFYAVYDTKSHSLNFSSAGHNPALIVRKNSVKELPAGGVALGAGGRESFERFSSGKNTMLEKNDLLVLYTDGIVEAMNNNNEEYGEERFYNVLKKNHDKDAETVKDAVIKDLKSFTSGHEQSDDITMLLMRIT
ncbi:MAG: SpoIIE family protein phosphatase [Spirochaetes bacterium]|nr:SpoIIE family protein phosphatase [Spirochaetota bacterium]MBN2771553.1 SpoIIE family protein phosphatase [Spirochaetota bacterium]